MNKTYYVYNDTRVSNEWIKGKVLNDFPMEIQFIAPPPEYEECNYGESGPTYPIPKRGNVILLCNPADYGCDGTAFGGLTYPGGRGGGCGVYLPPGVISGQTATFIRLRIRHEVLHLVDQPADDMEIWATKLPSFERMIYAVMVHLIGNDDPTRVWKQYWEGRYYDYLLAQANSV